jgi:hypothetical protein
MKVLLSTKLDDEQERPRKASKEILEQARKAGLKTSKNGGINVR